MPGGVARDLSASVFDVATPILLSFCGDVMTSKYLRSVHLGAIPRAINPKATLKRLSGFRCGNLSADIKPQNTKPSTLSVLIGCASGPMRRESKRSLVWPGQ